jgi:hypothetical protein
MSEQKFQVGQAAILLEPGTRLPAASVRIVGFQAENEKPYRIEYTISGNNTVYFEDVEENRLTSQRYFGLDVDQRP